MLDLSLIRVHLRLDDDYTDEDVTLTAYARAAWNQVEAVTGRRLYDVGALEAGDDGRDKLPTDAVENAQPLVDDLRVAMLLLVGHWYKNREAVSVVNGKGQQALPLAFDALVSPYRWFTL